MSFGDAWLESVRGRIRRAPQALRVGAVVVIAGGVGLGAFATRDAPEPSDPAAPEELSGASPAASPAASPTAASVDRALAETVAATAEAAESLIDVPAVITDGHAEPAAELKPEIEWASPREPSPIAPLPADERVAKPAAVRGIYIGAWSAGSAERLDQLIRLAERTEINAFVIDIKDVRGEVSYATEVPLAQQVGADRRLKIGDMRAVLDRLRERGIYPIARIVAFKDPLLAKARPEWAIQRKDGTGIWADNNGVHWVDSFNRNVWDYNIELAREAIALGFSEIQWDYVRFPDVPGSYMKQAVYTARDGRTMAEGIREFLIHSRERLGEPGVPITADVFGVTTSAFHDVGIGQVWEMMSDVSDALLPMVYPSHYPPGTWGFEEPNAAPYQIVRKALEHGVSRSRDIENPALIRPWLQAFTLGDPAYGPEHIRAQIDAVYDAGLTEWILWDPAITYPIEAFATEDGEDPWFAGTGKYLYRPDEDRDRERDRDRDGEDDPLGEPLNR